MAHDHEAPRPPAAVDGEPFADASQAWFWCMQAYKARFDGARIKAGLAETARPCEPTDVMRVVDRLYRQRRLIPDHIAVLGHYGRRLSAPEPERPREGRAALLWQEAMGRLGRALRAKGIVR